MGLMASFTVTVTAPAESIAQALKTGAGRAPWTGFFERRNAQHGSATELAVSYHGKPLSARGYELLCEAAEDHARRLSLGILGSRVRLAVALEEDLGPPATYVNGEKVDSTP